MSVPDDVLYNDELRAKTIENREKIKNILKDNVIDAIESTAIITKSKIVQFTVKVSKSGIIIRFYNQPIRYGDRHKYTILAKEVSTHCLAIGKLISEIYPPMARYVVLQISNDSTYKTEIRLYNRGHSYAPCHHWAYDWKRSIKEDFDNEDDFINNWIQ